MSLRQISSCRACQGPLQALFSLGDQYVIEYPETKGGSLKAPLNLVMCKNCRLVQLEHSINPSRLFNTFWYQSGLSTTMKSELEAIAKVVIDEAKLENGKAVVIDIGCNDGTLLKAFGPKYHRVGFEPSNLYRKATDHGQIIHDYFSLSKWRESMGGSDGSFWRADAITTMAMFYDLEDPSKFCDDIARILKPLGVWVDQQNYLGTMLQTNGFDNIVHEHLAYHSLTSLSNIVNKAGLEIYHVETNGVNGGSMRTFIAHVGAKTVDHTVDSQLDWEKSTRITDPNYYDAFFARISTLRARTVNFINNAVKNGKRIYILGAGTRGNTIVQFYGLSERQIIGAVDKNPDKWGRRIVGTDIPIIPRKEVSKADYFLVLPHHFLKEFIVQENNYLSNGGQFIVPIPDLTVYPRRHGDN